ncbi:DUF1566 domain-containing protein [Cupriavidus sp. EM10]|uniref:DUF1566 domain-containing protein n=1 Tax=Cupriavidus sp. EM10 TaxID=2839983 RepID=UPI001C007A08|nr:DUF1566 domain-containing protein [Cupriavidus sp. EM10]QWE95308.1 DUF1566 domain-containing protein [Cupriavidus sp. EM10]
MQITLDAIKAEQSRIGDMIAAFEKQASSEFTVAGATIQLKPGERYAGIVLDDSGAFSHHLILLPSQANDFSWAAACKWADEQQGSLPTRREQSLLFANLKSEFDERAYWSGEKHAENAGWAWSQDFYYGLQDFYGQDNELRARAVRRFIPSVI